MSKKIKLLFDMQQLEGFGTSKRTGIYRVADEIFKRLAKRDDIDLYCYLDKKYKNTIEYLKKNYPEHKTKLVYLPNLSKTSRDRNFIIRIKSRIYTLILASKYKKNIRGFDWYFSPFNKISPIVYESTKTSIFIHDIIPITHPQFVCPKFVKSYTIFVDTLRADFLFFGSNCSKNDFFNYNKNYDHKNTAIVSLSADEKFKPISDQRAVSEIKKKFNISTEKYFLSVSDLNPRKNILFAIKNFLEFIKKEKIKDLSLVLSGPNKKFIHDILSDMGDFKEYLDKIIISGFAEDEDLVLLYNGALAFVYVSLYEGFGLPPLESMKSGTPVIASKIPSLIEIVGDSAILTDPKNHDEMQDCFRKVYNDAGLRLKLSEEGKKNSANFSWDKSVDQMVKIWQNN